MITGWETYLILKLDDVRYFLELVMFFGIVISGLIHCSVVFNTVENSFSKVVKLIKRYIIALLVVFLIHNLIPTTKEMVAIKLIPHVNKKMVKVVKELINVYSEEVKKK